MGVVDKFHIDISALSALKYLYRGYVTDKY